MAYSLDRMRPHVGCGKKNKRGESYEKTVTRDADAHRRIVIRRLQDRHSIFQPSYLGLLLINVAFWLFDLAQLKAKKFTDKYGYTIRE